MQNWTTINEIPADVSRFISVEREDDKITSLVLSLPDCKPLRVIGHDYSKAIKLTGPTPPKDIEIFVIRRPDGDLAQGRAQGRREDGGRGVAIGVARGVEGHCAGSGRL